MTTTLPIRLATQQDNNALLQLFSSIPMQGSLSLVTERSPDFFRLFDIQKAHTECWIYEIDHEILGMGSLSVRPGWINGEPQSVAYLGDLRVARDPRIRGALNQFYSHILSDFSQRHQCNHFYTGILASNQRALRALTQRTNHRLLQPHYDLLRRYDAIQINLTRRIDASRMPFSIHTATESDIPEITEFLHRSHQPRPFGYRFDLSEFSHRLSHWPNFSLPQTYLARDPNGTLVGTTTTWDAAPLKRYRVLAYHSQMRLIKEVYNLGARLLHYPPLPSPGHCFSYLYLANLAIHNQDPRILRALLARITLDLSKSPSPPHFLMLYMEDNNPLNPALEGFSSRRLPFHLYAVRPPNTPPFQYTPNITSGFEIALA